MRRRTKRLALALASLPILAVLGQFGLSDGQIARSATHSVEATAYELIVVDGDTVRFAGESVRLMGYDTPEVTQPQCALEAELGDRATELLQTLLIQASSIRLDFEPHRDRYDRRLATLYINGRDIADLMIEARLARAYEGARRQSWCN